MRLLVTGHLSYIGTRLSSLLLAEGHTLLGVDSDLYRRCTFGPEEAIADVPTVAADIRDVTPHTSTGSTPSCTWQPCPTTRSATSSRI